MNHFFTKGHLIKTILFNTRLNDYHFFLANAKKHGYEMLPLCEFYSKKDRRTKKHMILRHDVDWQGESTRKMFEAEKIEGVRSTYYFRFSTIDKKLIDEMVGAGFEVGLHYETIADIIREQQLTKKSQIDINSARERFRDDIIRFEKLIGHKISSCCSHGAPENDKLEISNNSLIEGLPLSGFGLEFEAYDKSMYENDIDVHIMDCTLLYNYGFSYKDNPITAVSSNSQNIVFLSHPNHWFFSLPNRIKKIGGIMLGLANYNTTREFKRIEV